MLNKNDYSKTFKTKLSFYYRFTRGEDRTKFRQNTSLYKLISFAAFVINLEWNQRTSSNSSITAMNNHSISLKRNDRSSLCRIKDRNEIVTHIYFTYQIEEFPFLHTRGGNGMFLIGLPIWFRMLGKQMVISLFFECCMSVGIRKKKWELPSWKLVRICQDLSLTALRCILSGFLLFKILVYYLIQCVSSFLCSFNLSTLSISFHEYQTFP